MNCQDFATSRMKRKQMKCHPSYLNLALRMRFVGFNLSRYNSLDEQLPLNHFKKIFRKTGVHHIPLHLSDDQ